MNQIQNLEPTNGEHRELVCTSTKLVTLIIDDNPVDRRRLKSMCDKAGLDLDFVEVGSIAEMSVALSETVFDLIFIDYRLDDGDGLGALTLIKKNARTKAAATIMVAGIGQASVAVSALKSGCDDYILKDALDPHWLKRAVTNAVEKSKMQRVINDSEKMRAALAAVLRGVSNDCTVEMKPMLSQMLRRVRNLRGMSSNGSSASFSRDMDGLVQSCEQLWKFVEGFERSAMDACERQWPEDQSGP